MRKRLNWPESEPIPQTMNEALALGWEVEPGDDKSSEDQHTHTGTVVISKTVGLYNLWLEVPFRASYTYGAPGAPTAVVDDESECDRPAVLQ